MMEDHEPDGDTQYRIGSLTKTFVAVLIMRLRAEGLLNLADPGRQVPGSRRGRVRDDRAVAVAHGGAGRRVRRAMVGADRVSLLGRSAFFQDAWEVAGDGTGITWDHANPLTPPAYCCDARCDYVFVGAPMVSVGWSSGACRPRARRAGHSGADRL